MVTGELTEAQKRILLHVSRYRLTTVDVLHRLFYSDATRGAAQKAANRLVESELLQSYEVTGSMIYQLTRATASEFGVPLNAAAPLRSQSLRENYAVLAFCCLSDNDPANSNAPRERLTPMEFRNHFPEFASAPGIKPENQFYYLDSHNGAPLLGRATVDSGADTERIHRKCRDILTHALRTAHLCELVDQNVFVISVLTAEDTKRKAIIEAVTRKPLGCLFRAYAIPELSRFN